MEQIMSACAHPFAAILHSIALVLIALIYAHLKKNGNSK
jgi:hypothetical protein